MFRRLYNALARLLGPPRSNGPATDHTDYIDLARDARTPDPYVWRLPNPYDARWRRWAKRSRAAGRYLPVPREEECWQAPARTQPPPTWQTDDDVVRPYILRP